MQPSEDKQRLSTELSSPGDANADNICADSQTLIAARWRAQPTERSLLSLALDDSIEMDCNVIPDAKLRGALSHASQCDACLEWRKAKLEPERFQWIDRSKAYCCAEMFSAVQDAGHGIPIKFGSVAPENTFCWWVEPSRTLIRHCPWCGAGLTYQPADVGESDGGQER